MATRSWSVHAARLIAPGAAIGVMSYGWYANAGEATAFALIPRYSLLIRLSCIAFVVNLKFM